VWRWCSSVVCEAVQRRLLRVYLKSCACEHARTRDGRSVSCVVSDDQGKNIKWNSGQLKYVDGLNSIRRTCVRTYSEHVLSTRLFGSSKTRVVACLTKTKNSTEPCRTLRGIAPLALALWRSVCTSSGTPYAEASTATQDSRSKCEPRVLYFQPSRQGSHTR
jgi:hypothetical protein